MKNVVFITTYLSEEEFEKLGNLAKDLYLVEIRANRSKFKKALTYFSEVGRLIFRPTGIKFIFIYQYYSRIFGLKRVSPKVFTNIFINHGWGTKRTPGNQEMLDRTLYKTYRKFRKYTDYIICYSDFDSTYFLQHELLNDLPLPVFVPIGHPRNDFLVKNSKNESFIFNVKQKLGIKENKRVILFAPTHRESRVLKDRYDLELLEKYMSELQKIDKKLGEHNTVILFRPHYYFRNLVMPAFQNIYLTDPSSFPNPTPLMIISDVLVTDYSSIYVDYLLLQKPIIFYQHDLEYYQQIRGLVVDPKNPVQMPGPKINKLSEILDIDERCFQLYNLEASRNFFHKYWDDKATERLVKFLYKITEEQQEG